MAVQHTLFYDYHGPETKLGGGDGENVVDEKMAGAYIPKQLFDDLKLELPKLHSQYAVLREGRKNDKAVNLKPVFNDKHENIGACVSARQAVIKLMRDGVVNVAGAHCLGLDVQACLIVNRHFIASKLTLLCSSASDLCRWCWDYEHRGACNQCPGAVDAKGGGCFYGQWFRKAEALLELPAGPFQHWDVQGQGELPFSEASFQQLC